MSRTKLDFLVLAALVHDVGKLLERGGIFSEVRQDEHYLSFCPMRDGHPTHLHCAHTRKFCECLEEQFDCLRGASDKSWKDWAAAHHLNNEETLEAKVLSLADRLSAKEREEGDYHKHDINKKTLLEPVIERIFLGKNTKTHTAYRYPLEKLQPEQEALFPLNRNGLLKRGVKVEDWGEKAEGAVAHPNKWSHLLAERPLHEEYKRLAQGFLAEIDKLAEKQPELSLSDLIVSLTTLLEIYTANVPSATNVRHPDISLFDHLRTTAAIAQSLYLYQMQKENPLSGLESSQEHKWFLVCGDFSGIQKFIYNLTNKGAAKALRGRSFYVQYFCRICADFLLKELGLNRAALLYNSGGKFYLLIPAHLKSQLFAGRKQINKWLLDLFGGNVFLGLGLAKVSADMFEQGNMHEAWKSCAQNLEEDRQVKFKDHFEPDFFAPQTGFNPVKSCVVCGSRKNLDDDKCNICIRLEKLGQGLHKAKALLTVWGGKEKVAEALEMDPVLEFSFSKDKFEPALFLLTEKKLKSVVELKWDLNAECVFLDQTAQVNLTDYPLPRTSLSFMYLGRWKENHFIEKEDGQREPWTFEHYAQKAEGIKRLGILRMDVDNLGMVFIKGLRFPKREVIKCQEKDLSGWGAVVKKGGEVERKPMASISRMVTLSRQLNCFFSGYVGRILENKEFDKCQIIYAGGDDLFIIGSWHQLISLAKTINDKFREFCCHNPDLSISGGVTLIHGKYPIYKGAQAAGDAEKRAKTYRRAWNGYLKDHGLEPLPMEKAGFCFIDTPILWEDFYLAEKIKLLLGKEIEEKKNKGCLSYLLKVQATNSLKVCWIQDKGRSLCDAWLAVEYDPWRWRFSYQLKRRYKDDRDKIKEWSNIILGNDEDRACLPVFSWLGMPLNWVKLLYRE
jgi:CRISPR-associated protein Csm1